MTLLERESQLGSLLQYADEARDRARVASCWSPARPASASRPSSRSSSTGCPTPPGPGVPATACSRRDRWRRCTTSPARSAGNLLDDGARGAASRDEIFDAVLQCARARGRARRAGRRGRAVGRRGDPRPAPLPRPPAARPPGAAARHLPRRRARARRPPAGRPRRARRPALHPPHRPPAAHRRPASVAWPRARRTPPTSSTSSPEATRSSSSRCSATQGTRCRRRPATPCSPGPPGSTSRRRTTLDLAALDSWRVDPEPGRPRAGDSRSRPSTSWSRPGSCTADGRRRCASGTSWRGAPSSPRCRPTGGAPATGPCSTR